MQSSSPILFIRFFPSRLKMALFGDYLKVYSIMDPKRIESTSNHKRVVSGSCGGTIMIWDSATGTVRGCRYAKAATFLALITSIASSHDFKQVVLGSEERKKYRSGKLQQPRLFIDSNAHTLFLTRQLPFPSHSIINRLCQAQETGKWSFGIPWKARCYMCSKLVS